MKRREFGMMALAGMALAGCSGFERGQYGGPRVTSLVVNKAPRRMYLMHNTGVLRSYACDLGFSPVGHKRFEGDGRTPEGTYRIDRRNPNSRFHLSLGISYPNDRDRAYARSHGKSPGGDIFIHGQPNTFDVDHPDWTWGCIAVANREIEEIYAMVEDGVPITIRP